MKGQGVKAQFQEIHGVVDRLLLEQGEYSPLEMLLAEGRLGYGDYEAWRCGQIATLDEVLAGNLQCIRELLEQAEQYASMLGLCAQRRDFHSWGSGGVRVLQLSAWLDKHCGVLYRRAGNERQLDLFMDNTANVLVSAIVAALSSRRATEASALLEQLLGTDSAHPRLAVLGTLCDAALWQELPVGDYGAECAYLESTLTPLAAAELGAASKDYLSPLWQRLAKALQEQPFVAEQPLLHASYPLACARDWAGVKQHILAAPSWQDAPVLCGRLAEAAYHLGDHREALSLWCRMCWDFPTEALQIMAGIPDQSLRSAWQRYRDLEVVPELDISYFPAWLLLERKDSALQAQPHAPSLAYCALRQLLAEGSALTEQSMALRLKLKQAHQGLFAIYLRSLARR